MAEQPADGIRPGRRPAARAGAVPLSGAEAGAVTAEYAALLPVVVLVLTALVATAGVGVEQVRSQDAAASAARILARGDGTAEAQEAVRRMAGESARFEHEESDGWVTVSVSRSGPGPLGWFDGVRIGARARAPQQWPDEAAAAEAPADEGGGRP